MGENCKHHPERPARVVCQKMGLGYCQECLDGCQACTDPCGYCKFRSGCIIYELCRKSDKARELKEAARGLGV
jgi:hypothetical protein